MSDSCLMGQSSPAYETNFYAWTIQQAQFLQEQKWSCLDIPNLDSEFLGRQQSDFDEWE